MKTDNKKNEIFLSMFSDPRQEYSIVTIENKKEKK